MSLLYIFSFLAREIFDDLVRCLERASLYSRRRVERGNWFRLVVHRVAKRNLEEWFKLSISFTNFSLVQFRYSEPIAREAFGFTLCVIRILS
nr:MAG TPA: hypothetical protein [Caudoviricetes sp.]